MSMSTPHRGGPRRTAATKANAGGKPNPTSDDSTETETAKVSTAKPASKSAATAKSKSTATAKSKSTVSTEKSTSAVSTEKSASKSASAAKSASPAKSASKSTTRPAAKSGGPRRPITPVKVNQGRNWGPIALFGTVIVLALGIIGFGAWKVYDSGLTVDDRVERIDGAVNFRNTEPNIMKPGQHAWGPIKYEKNPPIGGKHNYNWQNCMGEVYTAPIATEHAVHSMEHGAVWVTYNPAILSAADVEKLAAKVRGKDYVFMSPFENLDSPISIQAWRFQLKVSSPDDKRIDEFISVTRKNAGIERADCTGGITETGTTPRDLGKDQQQQQPGG